MPSIEQNLHVWEREYDWSQKGDEWSQMWGGPEPQWYWSIYPRIHAFLPTPRILEIAPGFGRWTHFLKIYCERLTVVDLSPACIESCKERFQADSHISYYVNDGKSLDMIPDRSTDFVFSFDSLVHAEADVIEAYVIQLEKKLSEHGTGLIHHSNVGETLSTQPGELPFRNRHWRAESMTCKLFEQFCDRANLQCITQELIGWPGEHQLTDCFSLFTTKTSMWARPNVVISNDHFIDEAKYIAGISHGYTFGNIRDGDSP